MKRFGVFKCNADFGTKRVSLFFFFSRSFTASSIVAKIPLFGIALELIEKLRPFARRSVSTWDNCLEEILITHFFLSVILAALCVALFLLINSLNSHVCLFFVNSKDFLYKFSWIFSIRWNASGIIDSKILPFNCSMLFLSLSRITWLICIHSCKNSLPARCKIILLRLFLIPLFSFRSFPRILLWWQQRKNRKCLV